MSPTSIAIAREPRDLHEREDPSWADTPCARTRRTSIGSSARFRLLARALALRYARGSEPIDDLEQVANLAVVKALKRFDPDRGFAFTSFAVPTMALT